MDEGDSIDSIQGDLDFSIIGDNRSDSLGDVNVEQDGDNVADQADVNEDGAGIEEDVNEEDVDMIDEVR